MPIWETLFGGGVGSAVKAIGDVADNLFTSDEERAAGELALFKAETERLQVEQAGAQGQIEVNKIEAQHGSIFVAGWRPFIGWTCGFGLAYHFIGYPMLLWLLAVANGIWDVAIVAPPDLEAEQLLSLTGGLLGVAGLRTYERTKGVARGAVRPPAPPQEKKSWIKKIFRPRQISGSRPMLTVSPRG